MARIKKHNGRPAIFIDGVPYPPMMATIRTRVDRVGIDFDEGYFRSLGRAGIKIYFLICDTLDLYPEAFEMFDKEARLLLDAVPDAYIIPRIGMHPTNEWIRNNPDECVKYSDGESPPVHLFSESYETDLPAHYSLASEKWREERSEALKATILKIKEQPYSDRIIGYFLAAGGTSEWYYMLPVIDDEKGRTLGYSKAFKREFSKYLTEKYGTDESLQAHWKNPKATLNDPPIPEYEKHYFTDTVDRDSTIPKIRMYANTKTPPSPENGFNFGSFPDFDVACDVYDFYRAWNIATADSVLAFAKAIKEVDPEYLVGAFYGSQGCINHVFSSSTGGNVKVLESEYVDFLAAPGVYENRLPGGCTGQRQVQDSFALHNKIYIVEDDVRTLTEGEYHKNLYQIYDMQDSLNVLKREFGRTLCEDVQSWWFDQLIGGGRYKHPEIYKLFEQQQKIAKDAYTLDRRKCSEIALIIDEESMQAVSHHTTRCAVETFRNYELAKVGAPIDQYYHNDMANPDMPSYKLYIFLNQFITTPEERRVIHEKLKRDGAVALWVYAPGMIDPTRLDGKISAENTEALTGIKCEIDKRKHDSVFRWNGKEHRISEGFDKRALYGYFDRRRIMSLIGQKYNPTYLYDTYMYPTVYSVDKEAENLAYFLTTGIPAVTVKECDGFISVLHGSKYLKSDEVRQIARFAGCHIYSESDDTLYANSNFIVHHAAGSGKKKIKFKKKCSPYEVYEQRFYAKDVSEIEFDSYLGETKTFKLI